MISLADDAKDVFGKVMAWTDGMIESGFELCTFMAEKDYKKLIKENDNPRDQKINLAEEIVKIYFGEDVARQEKENFISTFAKKETPDEIKEYEIADKALFEAIASAGIVKSKSEARRNIEQGGVKVNEKVVEDIDYRVKSGDVIQKGKRFFIKAI